MGDSDFFAAGQWNFTCDLCGKKQKSSRAMKTWDGQYVCASHKEERNPQDFIRGISDQQALPWSRSAGNTLFVGINYTRSFSDGIPLSESIGKVLGLAVGRGAYTDTAVNGPFLNEFALNSDGGFPQVSVDSERVTITETHSVSNLFPFTENISNIETITFHLISVSVLNGAALNSRALGG